MLNIDNSAHKKRIESNTKVGAVASNLISLTLEICYRHGRILDYLLFWIPKTLLWSLNIVHYHFTLSLRAHHLQNWISISHNTAFGWCQEPLGFYCFIVLSTMWSNIWISVAWLFWLLLLIKANFVTCHVAPRQGVDSSCNGQTNMSLRRGIAWGTNIH